MPTGRNELARSTRAVAATAATPVVHCRRAAQLDYQSRAFQAQEGTPGQPAGGIVTIALPVPQPNQHYLVEKVYVTSTSTNAWTTTLNIGNPVADPAATIEEASGQGTYTENPALLVPSGLPFTVQFSGLSAQALCTARIQWSVWIAYATPMALS